MNHIIVSIIMPSYNSATTIVSSIESVQQQDYPHWELLITDDGSTDNTVELVRELADDDPRISIEVNPVNSGAGFSRNQSIKRSKGKYIAFLDSDDIWATNKLESQIKVLEAGYDVVCSHYHTFIDDIDKIQVTRRFPVEFNYYSMLYGNKVGNLTGIYNQDTLGKVYQQNIGHEDYLMWLELVKRAGKAFCVQEALAYYRVSSTSLSGNKLKASLWQWKIYREQLGLGLFQSIYYWYGYVLNALIRESIK